MRLLGRSAAVSVSPGTEECLQALVVEATEPEPVLQQPLLNKRIEQSTQGITKDRKKSEKSSIARGAGLRCNKHSENGALRKCYQHRPTEKQERSDCEDSRDINEQEPRTDDAELQEETETSLDKQQGDKNQCEIDVESCYTEPMWSAIHEAQYIRHKRETERIRIGIDCGARSVMMLFLKSGAFFNAHATAVRHKKLEIEERKRKRESLGAQVKSASNPFSEGNGKAEFRKVAHSLSHRKDQASPALPFHLDTLDAVFNPPAELDENKDLAHFMRRTRDAFVAAFVKERQRFLIERVSKTKEGSEARQIEISLKQTRAEMRRTEIENANKARRRLLAANRETRIDPTSCRIDHPMNDAVKTRPSTAPARRTQSTSVPHRASESKVKAATLIQSSVRSRLARKYIMAEKWLLSNLDSVLAPFHNSARRISFRKVLQIIESVGHLKPQGAQVRLLHAELDPSFSSQVPSESVKKYLSESAATVRDPADMIRRYSALQLLIAAKSKVDSQRLNQVESSNPINNDEQQMPVFTLRCSRERVRPQEEMDSRINQVEAASECEPEMTCNKAARPLSAQHRVPDGQVEAHLKKVPATRPASARVVVGPKQPEMFRKNAGRTRLRGHIERPSSAPAQRESSAVIITPKEGGNRNPERESPDASCLIFAEETQQVTAPVEPKVVRRIMSAAGRGPASKNRFQAPRDLIAHYQSRLAANRILTKKLRSARKELKQASQDLWHDKKKALRAIVDATVKTAVTSANMEAQPAQEGESDDSEWVFAERRDLREAFKKYQYEHFVTELVGGSKQHTWDFPAVLSYDEFLLQQTEKP